MKRSRGATVVELLFAMAILALVMTSAYLIFVQGLRTWTTLMVRTQGEDNMLVASTRLTQQLQQTDSNSLTLYDSQGAVVQDSITPATAISFLSTDPVAVLDPATGHMLWTRFSVWYLAPDPVGNSATGQALFLQSVKLAAPQAFPTQYQLPSFTANPTGDLRMLPDVVSFELTTPVKSNILSVNQGFQRDSPITFTLTVRWGNQLVVNAGSVALLENINFEPPVDVP